MIILEDIGMTQENSSERPDTRADPESQVRGGILESYNDIKNLSLWHLGSSVG